MCVCVASPPPPETLLGNKLLLYRRQQQRKPLYLYRTRPPPPFYRFLAPVFLFLSLEGRSTSSTVFGTGELRHSPYLFVAFAFFFSFFSFLISPHCLFSIFFLSEYDWIWGRLASLTLTRFALRSGRLGPVCLHTSFKTHVQNKY